MTKFNRLNTFFSPRPLLVVLFAAVITSGCVLDAERRELEPRQEVTGPGPLLAPELYPFLADAPPGATITVAESPWGSEVDLIAGRLYFAASGRYCRQLQIDRGRAHDGKTKSALACRAADSWESRPLVTEWHLQQGEGQ